jgi:hypothetical protein
MSGVGAEQVAADIAGRLELTLMRHGSTERVAHFWSLVPGKSKGDNGHEVTGFQNIVCR